MKEEKYRLGRHVGKKKQKGRENVEEPRIAYIAADEHRQRLYSLLLHPIFSPCSYSSSSSCATTTSSSALRWLRRAADHSYQHNYKLGCRLCVSLTSPHPSRRNTRSLSRPGETFVFVFFSFLHLPYLLLFFFLFILLFFLLVVFSSFVFLATVDSFYLVPAVFFASAANFFGMLSSTYQKFSIEKLRQPFVCSFSKIYLS